MPDLSGTRCPRCGHDVKHDGSSTAEKAARAIVGKKPKRVTCGVDTDLGWPCPCRSRFHLA
jgi:hypothetical protein